MFSFPWVIDGIAANESTAVSVVHDIVNTDPELGRAVLDLEWVSDDVSTVESHALVDLLLLSSNNLPMAWRAIGEPFMGPPFRHRDQYALRALDDLSRSNRSELLARISSQPWFNDGLDDLEAALLHAIVVSEQDFPQALVETHYVASAPITLPLAGDVDLVVVRHTRFPPDDHTSAILEQGVRAIEGIMGAPFPVDDLIVIAAEPDIWRVGRGKLISRYFGGPDPAHLIAAIAVPEGDLDPLESSIYHHIGRYYHLIGPKWLSQGTANFLESYVLDRTGVAGLGDRLAHLESDNGCNKENIQQLLDEREGSGPSQCDHYLGERFLLAMYMSVGSEVVSAALTYLYTQSSLFVFPTEDVIYHAFQSNVPLGREEAFKNAYRKYHGGPYADAPPSHSPDRAALVALYEATNGDKWLNNANWLNDAPVGTWYGVTADAEGRVSELHLDANQLAGDISPDLGSLSNLRTLSLAGNSLVGEIPPELASLANLETLDLGDNQLSGRIPPELGQLSSLSVLQLGSNQLSGAIPSELGSLTELTQLELQRNLLMGGIPTELGSLSSLDRLNLRFNRLFGRIPSSFGNLQNLVTLRLNSNRLDGVIPSELGNLTNLSELDLGLNLLSGEIPPELGNLANLRILDISSNQLMGEIPPDLGRLANLSSLHISRNQLTGKLPSELGNLTNLDVLYVAENRFTGCIPLSLRFTPSNNLFTLGLPYC